MQIVSNEFLSVLTQFEMMVAFTISLNSKVINSEAISHLTSQFWQQELQIKPEETERTSC